LSHAPGFSYPKGVPRRALLVFADPIHVDLARRALPVSVRPLFGVRALGQDISSKVDVHFFTSGAGASTPAFSLHRQAGQSFATRFENAIETIAKLGYDEVVAIGRDCPALSGLDIERAFAELKSSKLVLGPDHRGGCYLIAFRSADRALLGDIRWKKNTDCAELSQRAGAADVFLLPVKHDLDSWNDVRLFAHAGHTLARLAAFLLGCATTVGDGARLFASAISRHTRISQQMPPPAFVA
jgi:glycosyltransferase A (GT-A) superfamily protein (DUF2064 family)